MKNKLGHKAFVALVAVFVLMIVHSSSGMLHPAFGTDTQKKATAARLQRMRQVRTRQDKDNDMSPQVRLKEALRKEVPIEARVNKVKEELVEEMGYELEEPKFKQAEEATLKTLGLDAINKKTKKEPVVLVQAADGSITIERWKVEQMSLLLPHLKDENNQNVSLDASRIINAFPLQLVSDAYDALAEGKFKDYYDDLEKEYNTTLTDKKLVKGRLRLLRAASEKVGAKDLFALFTARMLPLELQQKINSAGVIVEPVCRYLKEELLKKAKKVGQPIAFGERLDTFAFTSDSSKCLMGGANGKLTLLDLKSGQRTQFIGAPTNSLSTDLIAFNKDGDRAISRHSLPNGGELRILWNVLTGQSIATLLQNDTFTVGEMAFSPDGKMIVSSSHNELILWDSSDGSKIQINNKGGDFVSWHPFGKYILSREGSSRLLLWNLETSEFRSLFFSNNMLSRAIFSPQTGNRILCAGTEGNGVRVMMLGFNSFDDINTIYEKSWRAGEYSNIEDIQFSQDEQQYTFTISNTNGYITTDYISRMDAQANDFSEVVTQFPEYSKKHYLKYKGLFSTDNLAYVVFCKIRRGFGDYSGDLLFFDRQTGELISSQADVVNIVHFGRQSKFFSFDLNGNRLFINNDKGIDIWQLRDEHDLQVIDKIKDKLDVAQSFLLYQLYLAKLKGSSFETPFKKEVFKTLPDDVKEMITECLLPSPEDEQPKLESVEVPKLESAALPSLASSELPKPESVELPRSKNIESSESLLSRFKRYLPWRE